MTAIATAATATETDVLQADDRRFDAMRKGDWAALDAALADDLTYVHSTARLESKAEHIGNLKAGKPHYRGIAPRERKARVHGNIGIVNGVSEMHVERDGYVGIADVGNGLTTVALVVPASRSREIAGGRAAFLDSARFAIPLFTASVA